MKIAVYPGSFDPVTKGHLNIITRASRLFDEVIVCVMVNSEKQPMFSLQERRSQLARVTAGLPNVRVDAHDGLLPEEIIPEFRERILQRRKYKEEVR